MLRLYQMKPEKVEMYRRKVMKVGGSVVVPLPKKLRQSLGILVGDYVRVWMGETGEIVLKKEGKEWDGSIKIKD